LKCRYIVGCRVAGDINKPNPWDGRLVDMCRPDHWDLLKAAAAPVGAPWLWMLAYGQHEERSPIYGYEATREAAMAAFAKSWRQE
jgi:hypothetical protein